MLPERYADVKVVLKDHNIILSARDTFNKSLLNNVVVKMMKRNQIAADEVQILQWLSKRDMRNCIVQLHDYFDFFSYTCVVMEPLGLNLYEMLKDNLFEGLHRNTVKKMTRQVLGALTFLEEQGIVHGDLKPENVCASLCGKWFKLIDFGHASWEHEPNKPTRVQSRYYRSPEVLFCHKYSYPIDMWSLGCMVYELITGSVLFEGNNDVDMLHRIAGYLGLPPLYMLQQPPRCTLNGAHKAFSRQDDGSFAPVVTATAWPTLLPHMLAFLQDILVWAPTGRARPQMLTTHVFLEYE